MFAQLLASAPSHEEGVRPTIISAMIHAALIALAVQITQSIVTAPSSHPIQVDQVYLAPPSALPPSGLPQTASTVTSSQVPVASIVIPGPPAVDLTGVVPTVDLRIHGRGLPPLGEARPGDYSGSGQGTGSSSDIWSAQMVDEPVSNQRVPKPVYPAVLAQLGFAGEVTLQYVVGADGRVEPASIVVLHASRPEFIAPAIDAIRQAEFTPARRRGVAVRQLVEQRVSFTPTRGS